MYIYWVSGETGSSGADSLCQASQWRGLLAVREAGHWDLLGYFPKTKNQLKNQKKNSKISIWAFFFGIFRIADPPYLSKSAHYKHKTNWDDDDDDVWTLCRMQPGSVLWPAVPTQGGNKSVFPIFNKSHFMFGKSLVPKKAMLGKNSQMIP